MISHPKVKESTPNGKTRIGPCKLTQKEIDIFGRALRVLKEAKVPFAVGGAFACHAYTGIWRYTKDLDVFLRPRDVQRALAVLSGAGFETELTNIYWLAKARKDGFFLDLIFAMGNGEFEIDDAIFENTARVTICGVEVEVLSIEELIGSKVYIAKRDRFDGSDVVHLIHSAQGKIRWEVLLDRLGQDRELLLWYLLLFDYVYPGGSDCLPRDLMVQLFDERRREWEKPSQDTKLFRGTLLDEHAFAVDVGDWGYQEPRKFQLPDKNEEDEEKQ